MEHWNIFCYAEFLHDSGYVLQFSRTYVAAAGVAYVARTFYGLLRTS